MEKFINSIKQDSIITINNSRYEVMAKSFYVTQKNPHDYYAKIFLEGHCVLVLAPADDFIYFGRDIGQVPYNYPTPELIEYEQEKYVKTAEDYQIVKELIFGSPLETEGEVMFIDYKCVSNDNKLISVGQVVRSGKRADIVAEVLVINDLSLEV